MVMSRFKQVGGFHTKLSKDMNSALYEVSGFHNSFCAACVLNYFGVYNTILEDIFNIGSSDAYRGIHQTEVLSAMNDHATWVRSIHPDIIIKDNKKPTTWEHLQIAGHMEGESKLLLDSDIENMWRFFKKVPKGFATIMYLPGHWTVLGRSAVKGEPIIIETQQGDSLEPGDIGSSGIYVGREAVLSYVDSFTFEGDYGDILISSGNIQLEPPESATWTEQRSLIPILQRELSYKEWGDIDEDTPYYIPVPDEILKLDYKKHITEEGHIKIPIQIPHKHGKKYIVDIPSEENWKIVDTKKFYDFNAATKEIINPGVNFPIDEYEKMFGED
tara:strand:- start:3423 stop:4412 length:990 start_codon:yes stop_codon:yes gene_type:complete